MRRSYLERAVFGDGDPVKVGPDGKIDGLYVRIRAFTFVEGGLGTLMVTSFLWNQCVPKRIGHDLAAGFRARFERELFAAPKVDADSPELTTPFYDYDLDDILPRNTGMGAGLREGVEAMSELTAGDTDQGSILIWRQGLTAYTATEGHLLHLAGLSLSPAPVNI